MPDLRPLFTDSTAAFVTPLRQPGPVGRMSRLRLDPDALSLLRDGLGRYDMEVRWLARLDDAGVLRLWRSWVGNQIYEAAVSPDGAVTVRSVEQDPDSYRGSVDREPELFDRILTDIVNTLRMFRAGHTPYGPAEGADPLPPAWPD